MARRAAAHSFCVRAFAGELFQRGQLLDAEKHFIILPDGIGHGGSSKPSDSLRIDFPRYRYLDMIRAQRLLLSEGLGVDHLYLVMGTSMGGMHTWLWGIHYPDFMDYLVPLASLPAEIAGRNRMIRKMIMDSITTDPTWNNGNYDEQPPGLIQCDSPANYDDKLPAAVAKGGADACAAADAFLAERIRRIRGHP